MKTIQKTFGLEVLLKLANIKLPEHNGEFIFEMQKRIERRVNMAIRKYNIKLIV